MRSKTLLVVAGLVCFTLSAAAANKNSIKIFEPVTVNGTQVGAGEYKVEWDESGAVKLLDGKKVVAQAQGKVVAGDTSARRTTYATSSGKLTEIQFERSKSKIVLEGGEQAKSD